VKKFIGQYFYNLLLAYDQFFNAVFLGDVDESISGRTGRAIASGKPKWWVRYLAKFVDWLFLTLIGEKDHVKNAIEPEERPMEKELWSWIRK
jgi:hypothetical protein